MSHDCDVAASGFEPLMFTAGVLFAERGPPKQGPIQGLLLKDQDKDLLHKDQDFNIKDQDKDKDFIIVLKESLRTRTRTRTNITGD